ncbi:malonyl-CoA decarboxylase [Neptuniibacter caesariensis]|uniref:Malonyl-CoA decarboxylase n=1 Tax=Neptuniibacter caesariensis TaxID=207954 RepID=A0A7U8C6Z4_NEPCE|nr:malonyl-CoA decarboxylase [Neptuniibacter caesariensis]EAR62702.1 Malonyl-CoA decarboxylase [Oceanospirillum sp. MED92] [Neptuniibacter caesariensis]
MPSQISNSFLDRTLNQLKKVWHELAVDKQQSEALQLSEEISETEEAQLLAWMDSCLTHAGGEVAARRRAALLGENYLALNAQGRLKFLQLLAQHYDVDDTAVEQAIEHWRNAGNEDKAASRIALRDKLDPPRMKLLSQFTELPEGIKFLVDMRAELLDLRKEYPELLPLEADLKRLLSSWFDIGLLQMEQINWHSGAHLLEKLIAYEAVHAIQSWDDLKNRLESDRRCFAFFHPKMPDEPLIFVEVALVQGLADNVQKLLDEDAPILDMNEADTAIFYSISNAQRGLAGISFGNFLIKRVVAELQHDYHNLTQFSTLSPIPGFLRWLRNQDQEKLKTLPGGETWLQLSEPRLPDGWHLNEEDIEARQEPLMKLAAHYLSQEKRRGKTALDPVTNFHLSNGAQIEQLNWLADSSENGLKQSAGLMVNYLYDLSHIESRSSNYSTGGEIAQSSRFKTLLKT